LILPTNDPLIISRTRKTRNNILKKEENHFKLILPTNDPLIISRTRKTRNNILKKIALPSG